MPTPLYTPRVNNNDDTVRLVHLFVEPGGPFRKGDPIADIETDKATFTVEAEEDGFLLRYDAEKGETIAVGSVLAWTGSSAEEIAPVRESRAERGAIRAGSREPTLKAALLLAQYDIDPAQVGGDSPRISAEEVLGYIRAKGLSKGSLPAAAVLSRNGVSGQFIESEPETPGQRVPLTGAERGMLRTVEWQRREAVAAYAEITYEESAWKARAAKFKAEHGLLLDPLLSQFAWELVQIARHRPEINSTIAGGERHVYHHVHLGFTVQSGPRLYVAVVREAEALAEAEFVNQLARLQRAAMKGMLKPEESSGATIGFTSMARWSVTRHMPVLMPHTALIVAHSAGRDNLAALGATYDHRVLTGADAVITLNELASAGQTRQ
jgi:pyruvate/2-oxoglutarate dehydrogenase complex dihydrolipoamide acyltransferase (E2) component